jgi:hypothetical protein
MLLFRFAPIIARPPPKARVIPFLASSILSQQYTLKQPVTQLQYSSGWSIRGRVAIYVSR